MPKNRTIEDLLCLSVEERRRLRVGKRRQGRRREKRRRLSRDEYLDYLRRNDFRTSRQLTACRKPGEPTVADYRREFGSWSQASEEAFGQNEPFPVEVTAAYLVKVVAEMNLWTRQAYEEAHEKHPEEVPSYFYVRREFKRWAVLRHFAERYDARRMLALYLRLMRKLGRPPTADECRKEEIDKHMLENLFGGRKYFRQNSEIMVRV